MDYNNDTAMLSIYIKNSWFKIKKILKQLLGYIHKLITHRAMMLFDDIHK